MDFAWYLSGNHRPGSSWYRYWWNIKYDRRNLCIDRWNSVHHQPLTECFSGAQPYKQEVVLHFKRIRLPIPGIPKVEQFLNQYPAYRRDYLFTRHR